MKSPTRRPEPGARLKAIGIAAGHGGFEPREHLLGRLREAGHDVIDIGDRRLLPDGDFPDFMIPLARAVPSGAVDRCAAIRRSGAGAPVPANKVSGGRARHIHEAFLPPIRVSGATTST